MRLEKTHYFDAVAICCRDDQKVEGEIPFTGKTLAWGLSSKGPEKDLKRKYLSGNYLA